MRVLHAGDICAGEFAGNDGILAEIFKVAAAEGASLDIQSRTE